MQLKKYGVEALTYIGSSQILKSYLLRKSTANKHSAKTYKSRLTKFGYYIYKLIGKTTTFDAFLAEVKANKHNPYDLLAEFAQFLQQDGDKGNEVRQKVKIAKKFMRFAGAPVTNEDFQEFVTLPKKVMPDLQAAEKEEIVRLLNNCKNQRLKTALMLCASMGSRKLESCAVKNSDVNFEKMSITFPGEYTKTKVERTRRMTRELAEQIKTWQAIKYRPHRIVNIKGVKEAVNPVMHEDDLMLAFWDRDNRPTPKGVSDALEGEYRELAERLKIQKKNGRRVLTFHRLRSFVFTTISSLGDTEFAHFHLGHSGSTYYRQSSKAIDQAYEKVEPYLTFLDVGAMEASKQDLQSKVERLEQDNLVKTTKIKSMIAAEVEKEMKHWEEVRRKGKELAESYRKKNSTMT